MSGMRGRMEQYYYIDREVRLLEARLRRNSGGGDGLALRRDALRREREELEAFVECLDNSRLRQILTLRYLEGLEWGEVAAHLGHRESMDSVRKAAVRFLQRV